MSSGVKPPGDAVAAMVEGVLPGVVQVCSRRMRGRRERGTGAGFLWSPEGFVMTNHHVVAGSRRIGVVLADGRSFGVEVVGSSSRLDLAMLRLRGAPGDLPTPRIEDSDFLRVGELIFAVGHPWGRRGAVTAGIVSSLGSVGRPFGRARYVQTDAYLAPENSGGPLVNAAGEVVEVNAMISDGLSLTIPINAAGAWASGGLWATPRPRLGVRVQGISISISLREAAGQETGVMIVGMKPDGLASRAGLFVGDVLLDVAGEPLGDAASLRDALARPFATGDPVRLRVMRGGEVRHVEVGFDSPKARGA